MAKTRSASDVRWFMLHGGTDHMQKLVEKAVSAQGIIVPPGHRVVWAKNRGQVVYAVVSEAGNTSQSQQEGVDIATLLKAAK